MGISFILSLLVVYQVRSVYPSGLRQSPIDIGYFDVDPFCYYMSPFSLPTVWPDSGLNVKNNGHTMVLNFPSTNNYNIFGGSLPNNYELINIHFHWGKLNEDGSEHAIDGHRYKGEMHIVTKMVGVDVSEALNMSDGLAVIGFFLEESSFTTSALIPLLEMASHVVNSGDEVPLTAPINLNELFDGENKKFFRYHGSLTTPDYNESVIWTVFQQPIPLGTSHYQDLLALQSNHHGPISGNFRTTQPINGRQIIVSCGGGD